MPVLEEVRAQIQQALQKTMASSSPSSRVFSPVRITKVKGTKNKKKTTMKRNISIRLLAKDRVTHKFPVPCRADLMLLCSGRIPEWDPNNEKFLAEPGSNAPAKGSCGCSFALAFVTFGRLSPTIAANVYAQNEGSLLCKLQDSECPWFGVLLNINLTPVLRIWNALHRPLVAQKIAPCQPSLMQELLEIQSQVRKKELAATTCPYRNDAWMFSWLWGPTLFVGTSPLLFQEDLFCSLAGRSSVGEECN
jgi:hypothetical protein